jgi:probable phosphoglycerate mutase
VIDQRLRELGNQPEPRGAGAIGRIFGEDGVTEILLIRHGHIPAGLNIAQDVSLSEIGREQSEVLGAYLAAERPLDAIFASPYRRAGETAAIIARHCGLTVETIDELHEMEMYLPEGKTLRDVLGEAELARLRERRRRERRYDIGGKYAESSAHIRARVVGAIEAEVAKHTGKRLGFVAHGPVINAYVAHVLECPIDLLFQPNLTSVSIIWAKDDYRDLRTLNSMAHFGRL